MDGTPFVIDGAHLRKSFNGKPAVFDFSLQAKSGEIIGFLGPNGSGKTTTIRMLCGLTVPDAGKGTCLGYDLIKENQQIRQRVGYMTQRFSLYTYLTPRENIRFIAQGFNIPNLEERINEVITRLDLTKRQHQLTAHLSGGYKQRLALAAALIHRPKLLLLDEPTAGVDPQARRDFWRVINEFAAEGITVLVSTHYMDEAERCHRILYLAYGKLIISGYIDAIINDTKISTWEVSSKDSHTDIFKLASLLQTLPDIEQVTPFGLKLHVSGSNRSALLKALRPHMLNMDYHWQGIAPTLEDIFINFGTKLKDSRFD